MDLNERHPAPWRIVEGVNNYSVVDANEVLVPGLVARVAGQSEVLTGWEDFMTVAQWQKYANAQHQRIIDFAARLPARPRSPLDILIDRACGLE